MSTTTKTTQIISDFEIVYHGIDFPDYFQGCGVSGTEFDHVATGIGNTPREAIDDCLEQIATSTENLDTDTLDRILDGFLSDVPGNQRDRDFVSEHIDEHCKSEGMTEGETEDYDSDCCLYYSVRYNLEEIDTPDIHS
jgi:hypothetical protein